MDFNINELETRSFTDLRRLFTTIPREDYWVTLSGQFSSQSSQVIQALAYLPRQVTSFHFNSSFDSHGRIGNALPAYVAALPASIRTVIFEFAGDSINRLAITDLTRTLRKLPQTVTHLELRGEPLNKSFLASSSMQKISLFSSIPDSVQAIQISKLNLGALPFEEQQTVFSALNPGLIELSLFDVALHQSENNFLTTLPQGLKKLALENNGFHKKTAEDFATFLSFVSAGIETLSLSDNELDRFSLNALETILSAIPATVKTLDLNDNGFLMFSLEDFQSLLSYLPPTVSTLGISEYRLINLSTEGLRAHLRLLPSHIKGLTLRGGDDLFAYHFSAEDTIEILSSLPNSLGEIDLSDLTLETDEALIHLVSHLPASIHTLRLNDNHLASRPFAVLRTLFANLSPKIKVLDLSHNGFGHLPVAQRQALLNDLPSTVKTLITGNSEFVLRNDGALVSFRGVVREHLVTEKRFIKQTELAPFRIILMQVLSLVQAPLELQTELLAYVFQDVTSQELRRLAIWFSTLIISSVPPDEITAEHQKECLAAVRQRIGQQKPEESCLDLSRCGLNRLYSNINLWELGKILRGLPKQINSLKLRGNGFLFDDYTREVFFKLIPQIPDGIHCLDLSDNGFEPLHSQALAQVFAALPPHIESITLGHENPLPPAVHLAKRNWPESYWDLVALAPDKQGEARALLNDYSKYDSAFLRFLSGHWNRNHTEKASRLVHAIDNGLLDEADLQEDIDNLSPQNPGGSLARRLCFFSYHQPRVQAVVLAENHSEDNEVELQSLTDYCFK